MDIILDLQKKSIVQRASGNLNYGILYERAAPRRAILLATLFERG